MGAERGRGPWAGRRLHFVGVGGAGMSGLALIAVALGASVSGSDRSDSPYLQPLRDAGVVPALGHAAANVPPGAQVVYSTAIDPANPERTAGLPEHGGGGVLHRSELLAEIAGRKRCLAVSGAAGKTTTSAMIVHILQSCGMDPAYVVGGELVDTGRNAGWGTGDWIVVEADESDRSLLNYVPEIAVLTNSELDHHSTYRSRLDLEATFATFLARAKVAVVWDRPGLLELARGAAEATAYDIQQPRLDRTGASFQWHGIDVWVPMPGHHNALNAAGALTASVAAGAEPAAAAAALADFHGVKRRMQLLGRHASGAQIYDDYAHHPMKVQAALAAARTLQPARLVVVFQPHLFSRTKALASEFGRALAPADLCCVTDVYPARENHADFPGVDGRLVAAAAADAGGAVAWMPRLDDAARWLDGTLREGDLCVVMGAGNIDSLGRALVGAQS
ncbi:MAG: UDP-N-acetylmuramate--L-alanine ligase [Solirubrobacteraceae bacterium]